MAPKECDSSWHLISASTLSGMAKVTRALRLSLRLSLMNGMRCSAHSAPGRASHLRRYDRMTFKSC